MVSSSTAASGNLAGLRSDAMRSVLLGLLAGIYIWLGALYLTSDGFHPGFCGPLLTGGGLVAAWISRRRRPLAGAAALVSGLMLGILASIWYSGVRLAPYFLATPVALTGLFFSLQAVLAVTSLSCAMVLLIGTLRFGLAAYSGDLLAPVLVIGSVGILCALAVRNLYVALYWAWERTEAAQRNERELRERRAELTRTAKALDEACQRLEYLNYDLAQAREAAEEARLLKQQFATTVSHELRTPLNVIVAFAEMMYLSPESYGGVPLPAEYLGDLREIYRASQSLLRLIDDVLELSQIEANRLRLYCEPGDLGEVIAEAAEIIRPLVRGKQIQLTTEVPPDLPPVYMDRARVRQVLLNLLNNARRFTERGRISVHAAVEGDEVRITVADTGIGIRPADQGRVFEEFRQLDGSLTRQRDGTGLGLAISRRFVELHGGRIWVESEGIPGRGTRFHFTLPIKGTAAMPPPRLQRTPLSLQPPRRGERTLMLLDNDPAVVRLVEDSLAGYHIVTAGAQDELQALVAQHRPLALVLNAAGDPSARPRIEQAARCGVPVITCPLVYERHLGQALGAVAYLIKPVSRASLAAAVEKVPGDLRSALIVDDDPRMTRVLQRMLRALRPDCQVRLAYSGAAAIREARRERPDLLLLDLLMPEMDGITVLARLRGDPALASIPVIVISARDLTPDEVRRLGRRSFHLTHPRGLSNEEALTLLRSVLDSLALLPTLPRFETAERREQGSLGHWLAHSASSTQGARQF
mgnify:CR=1 FL=1